VLRALVDAIAFIQEPDNKTAVLKSLAQWLRLPKPKDALPGYDFMRKMYARRIYPNIEGIRNSIRVLTLTNEKFGRLKAEDLLDDRIVKKLEKEGLFDWLAIPKFLSSVICTRGKRWQRAKRKIFRKVLADLKAGTPLIACTGI